MGWGKCRVSTTKSDKSARDSYVVHSYSTESLKIISTPYMKINYGSESMKFSRQDVFGPSKVSILNSYGRRKEQNTSLVYH